MYLFLILINWTEQYVVSLKICLILSVRGKDYIKLYINDFSFKDKKRMLYKRFYNKYLNLYWQYKTY